MIDILNQLTRLMNEVAPTVVGAVAVLVGIILFVSFVDSMNMSRNGRDKQSDQ